jgi:hypothetical protein
LDCLNHYSSGLGLVGPSNSVLEQAFVSNGCSVIIKSW